MRLMLAFTILASATPALAATTTYDAFSSFSPTPGQSGAFIYGSFNVQTATFTEFAPNGRCNTPIMLCQSANELPAVFKSPVGRFVYSTATVPGDGLAIHPGSDANETNSVAIVFTAPRTGVYTFDGTAAVSDIYPNGTNLYVYVPSVDPAPVHLATLGSNLLSYSLTPTLTLARGQTAAMIIGNDGDYRYDTTAVNLSATIAGVPEAGAWATMIAGLALVGVAGRRRRITVAA